MTSSKLGSFSIAVHGGAGDMSNLSEVQKQLYTQKLQEALEAGYKTLEENKSAVDAVESAILVLEDSPLFNAGKGAVFNCDGIQEMDAAIMDGKTLQAGAVAGLRHIKNPISAAKCIMYESDSVFLIGRGAEDFVKSKGILAENTSYFFTQFRYSQFLQAQGSDMKFLDHDTFFDKDIDIVDKKYGTVGAVAIDLQGNIAAGTSTGGMTNKKDGRLGDSAIIGAGTYANNSSCGVSCTGEGEYFIRLTAGHEISSLMKYKKMTLKEALFNFINEQLSNEGGKGGVVAIDKDHNVSWNFNTKAMFRGYKKSTGEFEIKIF